MRHVIYFLLVANIVFFGWQMLQLQKQDGMERALPALPVTAKPLVTLQEMEQKQKQKGSTDPESKSETEPRPEAQPMEPFAMVESLTELQPPGGGGAITCRTLGPIMAVAQLKALGSKLDEMGLDPRHRTSEIQEISTYWVYLPSMEYSQAQEIKRKLDAHGDKEYYLGKDNIISLGTFREISRADVRMRQARTLELDPVMEPRYSTQTAHWLDIDRQTSNAVDLGMVMEEYPGIGLSEQTCY